MTRREIAYWAALKLIARKAKERKLAEQKASASK